MVHVKRLLQILLLTCFVTYQQNSSLAAHQDGNRRRWRRNRKNHPGVFIRNNYNSNLSVNLDKGNTISYFIRYNENVKTKGVGNNTNFVNSVDTGRSNKIYNHITGGSNEVQSLNSKQDGNSREILDNVIGNGDIKYERKVATRITGEPAVSGIPNGQRTSKEEDRRDMTPTEQEREKNRIQRQGRQRKREMLRRQKERKQAIRESKQQARKWEEFDRKMDNMMWSGWGNWKWPKLGGNWPMGNNENHFGGGNQNQGNKHAQGGRGTSRGQSNVPHNKPDESQRESNFMNSDFNNENYWKNFEEEMNNLF